MFPKIKKRVSSFLVGEDGKISKQALVSLGAFLGGGVLAGILMSKEASAHTQHDNSLTLGYSQTTATATHGHHVSHVSHGSHGSHSSGT